MGSKDILLLMIWQAAVDITNLKGSLEDSKILFFFSNLEKEVPRKNPDWLIWEIGKKLSTMGPLVHGCTVVLTGETGYVMPNVLPPQRIYTDRVEIAGQEIGNLYRSRVEIGGASGDGRGPRETGAGARGRDVATRQPSGGNGAGLLSARGRPTASTLPPRPPAPLHPPLILNRTQSDKIRASYKIRMLRKAPLHYNTLIMNDLTVS
ncbi:jg18881 [Pararge aegeria aegeria]|uniref:Jg18881 protein n=1 Tax=Pararge aegeria aegeria TaxID=348720 RepID=A0A8S4RU96_9NEOP|nr:jg18881 [Pararge aegeria aegeria]